MIDGNRTRAHPHRHLGLALRALARRVLPGGPAAAARAGVRVAPSSRPSSSTARSIRCSAPSTTPSGATRRPTTSCSRVKGSRYITHMLRLKERARRRWPTSSRRACSSCATKLGPILWQFPPQMPFNAERFDAFFALLPRDTESARAAGAAARLAARRARTSFDVDRNRRIAPRGGDPPPRAFVDQAFIALLRRHRIALVVADTAGRWPLLEDVTSDFVYVRLHGDKELYASGYGDAALRPLGRAHRAWAAGSAARRRQARLRQAAARRAAAATCTATSTTTSRCTHRTTRPPWRPSWVFRLRCRRAPPRVAGARARPNPCAQPGFR